MACANDRCLLTSQITSNSVLVSTEDDGVGAVMAFTVYASDGTTVVKAVSASDPGWSVVSPSSIVVDGLTPDTTYVLKLDAHTEVAETITTLTNDPKVATEDQWKDLVARVKAAGPGKAKVLTSADYNYPTTGTKTAIALWLLDDGVYEVASDSVNVRCTSDTNNTYLKGPGTYIITSFQSGYYKKMLLLGADSGDATGSYYSRTILATGSAGAYSMGSASLGIWSRDVQDNLTSTYTDRPLSAYQGNVLKNRIDYAVIRGSGAPTTATQGRLSQLYEDTYHAGVYQCVSTGAGGGGYIWKPLTVPFTTNEWDALWA